VITSKASAAPVRQASFLRSLTRVTLERTDILLASLILNVLTLALPLVILQVYDRIIPNNAVDTFALLVLGLTGAVLIDLVLRSIRSYIANWEAARFEHAIAKRAVSHMLNSDIEAFESVAPSTHMDRISSIEHLREFHAGQGLISVSDLPFVALFLALIWVIAGELVLLPLAVVAAAGVFSIGLGWRLDRSVRRRSRLDEQRYNFVFQVLNGIHTVKGLGLEAQMCRRYESRLQETASAVHGAAFYAALGRAIGPVFSGLAMFSIAAFGSQDVIAGTLSSGSLVACTLLAGRAVQPLIRMIGVWMQSQNLKLAEERLDQLLTMPHERTGPERPNGGLDGPLVGDIVLDGVTVHRGNPDYPLLSNVKLSIAGGDIVAVTGPLGGGKSALLELIAGFVHPTDGRVLIDGHDSRDLDMPTLRREIGYVRQNAVLYRGTILDNLTGFQGREALHDALTMAHRLGLDEDIARMPKGLRTDVGDTASEALAGSVKQQIALVRTLARAPKLLLLDEANAVLDMDADRRLRDLLLDLRGQTTVLMVTSRPSLIRIADTVLRVDRGLVSDISGSRERPDVSGLEPT
jgi:ATP-binding cassette subfamily C protein LapB